MSTAPLLSVADLSKSFGGVDALRGVDLQIMPGEIRCLAGENGSGKSTFVKIVSGVHTPSSGRIEFDGRPVHHLNPRHANALGIQVIYQDLSLFAHLSVAENIAINRLVHDGSRLVHRKQLRRIAQEQLEKVGVDLPLDATVASLSVANRQVVAICRALSMDARLLFMDEPTTALTGREVARLLSIILDLKQQGLSVVFISHKLDEVFEVADSITIFRDGRKVGDFSASELDEVSLSRHMTGRDVTYKRYHRTIADDTPLLEVRGLTRQGNYRDVDLTVRPGDIVGLTGLLGSGRTELALSLFGLNAPDSGEVRVRGEVVNIGAPWEAVDAGVMLLPEDRHEQGLFGTKPVRSNVSVTMLDRILTKFRTIDPRSEKRLAVETVNEMSVNNKDTSLPVENLSGGNQQKVVIGKWMARGPSVFVLDSPTVGVDIGSKSEIYDQIHRLADSGMGVVLISDEPAEIVANCNTVVVMHDGEVLQTFLEDDLSGSGFEEQLVRLIDDPTYRVGGPTAAEGHAVPAGATARSGATARKEKSQ